MNKIFIAAQVIAACVVSAHASEACLTYANSELVGTLVRQTFAEQPNYESIAAGDAPATYFFVKGAKSFCATAGADTTAEPGVRNIRTVQLVFTSPSAYDQLRPWLGRSVRCRGSLFHAISGHHHSRVLLQVEQCNLSGASAKQ